MHPTTKTKKNINEKGAFGAINKPLTIGSDPDPASGSGITIQFTGSPCWEFLCFSEQTYSSSESYLYLQLCLY